MQQSLPPSHFKRNLAIMISGTSAAQMITFATAPLLTRLYTPADFGIFAIFNVFATILGVIATFRYENAVMLPKDESSAYNVLCLSFSVSVVFSVASGPLLGIFFTAAHTHWLGSNPLWTGLLPLWSLNIAMNAFSFSLMQWNTRQQNYPQLVRRAFVERIVNVASSLLFFFWFKSFWGLIGGQILGLLASNIYMFTLLLPTIRANRFPSWSVLKGLAYAYKDFPLHSGWASILQLSAWQLPQLFIGLAYSVSAVGQYNLAVRMLEAPLALCGNIFSNLYYRKMASETMDRWPTLISRSLKVMLLGPVIPVVIMALFAPKIFALVFGDPWYEAGQLSSILVILYWFRLMYVSQSSMLALFRRLDMDLKFSAAIFTTQLLAVVIGHYGFDSLKTVTIAMSSLTSMVFAFGCYWIWRYARKGDLHAKIPVSL